MYVDVPTSWIHPETMSEPRLDYVRVHANQTMGPQVLPDRLLEPIFADIVLGDLLGQNCHANALRIEWERNVNLADEVRRFREEVPDRHLPLPPDRVEVLAYQLGLPFQNGPAVVKHCLEQIWDHIHVDCIAADAYIKEENISEAIAKLDRSNVFNFSLDGHIENDDMTVLDEWVQSHPQASSEAVAELEANVRALQERMNTTEQSVKELSELSEQTFYNLGAAPTTNPESLRAQFLRLAQHLGDPRSNRRSEEEDGRAEGAGRRHYHCATVAKFDGKQEMNPNHD
ncbi:hypothetical protein CERZMDRAFT_87853 [Cercospora zeae-maydis SCOH1-5]|uniref:Uncharacterized protein n=1 Tax=Cercospora zeae-maydis SCOH1-5 TaxID=717836 RepID=A0A6A6F3B8_9PEZI|nr:hypothetical protein CERZMDRAFT_87853 [Cercospora zeae-maydis SCOH1-5]